MLQEALAFVQYLVKVNKKSPPLSSYRHQDLADMGDSSLANLLGKPSVIRGISRPCRHPEATSASMYVPLHRQFFSNHPSTNHLPFSIAIAPKTARQGTPPAVRLVDLECIVQGGMLNDDALAFGIGWVQSLNSMSSPNRCLILLFSRCIRQEVEDDIGAAAIHGILVTPCFQFGAFSSQVADSPARPDPHPLGSNPGTTFFKEMGAAEALLVTCHEK